MCIIIIDKNYPLLTKQHIMDSLNNTNSYCFQGIAYQQQTSNSSEEIDILSTRQISGLDVVISVLEEVLRWPSKVGRL